LASVLGTALLLQARLALAPLASLALRLVTNGLDRANATQKQLFRASVQTFADWCAEVRDLAGERWPEVSRRLGSMRFGAATRRATGPAHHGPYPSAARHGGRRGQL
jgi:hypothetical protein